MNSFGQPNRSTLWRESSIQIASVLGHSSPVRHREIDVVLVARRESLLREIGKEISRQFGVEYRVWAADLATENFMNVVGEATGNLEISTCHLECRQS